MDITGLLLVAARTAVVYAFLFVAVRLLGKRKLGIHSAFDLIIAIVMADLASEAIFGGVSLWHGLFAVAIIAGYHLAGSRALARWPQLYRLAVPEAAVVVRDGEVLQEVLRAERLSETELMSLLRQHGVDSIDEVQLAILEPNGALSVVRQEWAQIARKGDVQGIVERSRA